MNKYESVCIITPKFNNEQRKSLIGKIKNIMQGFGNKEVTIEDIGLKRLAYEVKKQKEGYYVIFNFESKSEDITELERNYRILQDEILKFIVVRKED